MSVITSGGKLHPAKKQLRWSMDFVTGRARERDLASPPGYNPSVASAAAHGEGGRERVDQSLVIKRSWDLALGPLKQVPMNMFIMYMAGNSISIFPIMMVGMLFMRPIKAILSVQSTFASIEGSHAPWQKLVYLIEVIMVVSHDIMKGLKTSPSAVKLNTKKQKLKNRFEIIRKLGEGTCGKVQLGLNRETGQQVAVKSIKKSKIQTDDDLTRIRREIQIMSSVRHPSIIHIFEVFENKDKIVLVMEYAAGGELYDYIVEKKGLSESDARRIFRQVAAAVYYCHKHKICHRDLKLENVLMDEHGNAKIADFGLSNIFDGKSKLTTYCGSPLYASPEVVKGVPYLGPEVDCWSLGVLLYTLVYGAMPFDGSNFKRLVKQITTGEYAEPAGKSEASELIKGMLTPNPLKRLTIEEICSHWWVNEGYDVSCLVVADELARQTPVRLDLLLALAPCPKSSKSLVIDEDSSLSLATDEDVPPLEPAEENPTEGKKKKKKGKKKKEAAKETDDEETSRTDEEKVSQAEDDIEEPSVAEELPREEVHEEAKTPTPAATSQQPNFTRFKSLEEEKRHESLLVPSKTAPGHLGKRLLFEEDEEDEESTVHHEGEDEDRTPVVDKTSLGSWPSAEEETPPVVPQKKTSTVVISLMEPSAAATAQPEGSATGVKTIKSEIKFTVAPTGSFLGDDVADDRTSVLARQLGVKKEPGLDAVPECRPSFEEKKETDQPQLRPPSSRPAALQHSRREFIIPIALEEGGYAPTPASSVTSVASLPSEEAAGRPSFFSSTSLDEGRRVVGSSSSLMGRMKRMMNDDEEAAENTGHGSRYRRYGSAWSGSALDGGGAAAMSSLPRRKPPVGARYKITIQKSGSVSSTDDDDDDFNLLSADSLFNSMLSRVKDASKNFRQEERQPPPQPQEAQPTPRSQPEDEDEWFNRPMSSFFSSTASASPFSSSRTSRTNLGSHMGSFFETSPSMSSVSQRARSLMSSLWDDSEWSEFFRS